MRRRNDVESQKRWAGLSHGCREQEEQRRLECLLCARLQHEPGQTQWNESLRWVSKAVNERRRRCVNENRTENEFDAIGLWRNRTRKESFGY